MIVLVDYDRRGARTGSCPGNIPDNCRLSSLSTAMYSAHATSCIQSRESGPLQPSKTSEKLRCVSWHGPSIGMRVCCLLACGNERQPMLLCSQPAQRRADPGGWNGGPAARCSRDQSRCAVHSDSGRCPSGSGHWTCLGIICCHRRMLHVEPPCRSCRAGHASQGRPLAIPPSSAMAMSLSMDTSLGSIAVLDAGAEPRRESTQRLGKKLPSN